MRSLSSVLSTPWLRVAFLCVLAATAACAAPAAGDGEEEAVATSFDNLSADEAEIAAAAFLARHDALGTDFEPRESEAGRATTGTVPATVSPGLAIASVSDDARALEDGPGTWAYQFTVVRSNGERKTLASSQTSRTMLGASTFKLFTGWTAFVNKSAGASTLTTMLRASDNRLANLAMCRNGEVLGRYDVACSAREYATSAMRMQDAIRESTAWLGANGVRLSDAFSMHDGSGLLEENELTVDDLMSLLFTVHGHARAAEFRKMLAQPGVASTLRNRFRGLEGKVFAKTGTYNDFGGGVKSLAGFAMLPRGNTLVFAVVGNQVGSASAAMVRIEKVVTDVIAHAPSEL